MESKQPFFEFYPSADVPGLFVCSLCGALVKYLATHANFHGNEK